MGGRQIADKLVATVFKQCSNVNQFVVQVPNGGVPNGSKQYVSEMGIIYSPISSQQADQRSVTTDNDYYHRHITADNDTSIGHAHGEAQIFFIFLLV